MKIRLIICTLLIAFLGNVAFAVIVAYLFSVRHELKVLQRSSSVFVFKHLLKSIIEMPPEFSLIQNVGC